MDSLDKRFSKEELNYLDVFLSDKNSPEEILQKLKELSISPLNPNGTFKTFFTLTEEIINAFHHNKIDN
jgi:hypothetical protein